MERRVSRVEAAEELCHWARRTTMEGLPNLTSTPSIVSRMFWLVALATVTVVGMVHLVTAIQNFLSSGLYSEMTFDATPAEFPDVTICSLKPVSEVSAGFYGDTLLEYIEYDWGYFDDWFVSERRQRPTENDVDYAIRVQKLFRLMLEILWVYNGLKPLRFDAKTAILECRYNGIHCDHTNFSLVEHIDHQNCYTFSPHKDHSSSISYGGEYDAGLSVSIFTDDNYYQSAYESSTSYKSNSNAEKYRKIGMSLKQFLIASSGESPINRLTMGEFQTDGALIFLHQRNTYPLNHHAYKAYILQNGMSATYRVETVEQKRMNRPESPCFDGSPSRIEYVTTFSVNSSDVQTREFIRTASDFASERFQQEIFERCGCYSHRFPFRTNHSSLCLYTEPLRSNVPPELQQRIDCHEKWVHKALHDVSLGKHRRNSEQPCRRFDREVQVDFTEWPSEEDIESAMTKYFQYWLNGTNPWNMESMSKVLAREPQLVERGPILIKSLLKENCTNVTNSIDQYKRHIREIVRYCLNSDRVLKNFLRFNVRLTSSHAVTYEEKFSYTEWEILSEIGGILGLWFGVSALTLFELIELYCIIACSCRARMNLRLLQSSELEQQPQEHHLEQWEQPEKLDREELQEKLEQQEQQEKLEQQEQQEKLEQQEQQETLEQQEQQQVTLEQQEQQQVTLEQQEQQQETLDQLEQQEQKETMAPADDARDPDNQVVTTIELHDGQNTQTISIGPTADDD